jgi:hypothetical protein
LIEFKDDVLKCLDLNIQNQPFLFEFNDHVLKCLSLDSIYIYGKNIASQF